MSVSQGRPRDPALGINRSITFHSSSVRSLAYRPLLRSYRLPVVSVHIVRLHCRLNTTTKSQAADPTQPFLSQTLNTFLQTPSSETGAKPSWRRRMRKTQHQGQVVAAHPDGVTLLGQTILVLRVLLDHFGQCNRRHHHAVSGITFRKMMLPASAGSPSLRSYSGQYFGYLLCRWECLCCTYSSDGSCSR